MTVEVHPEAVLEAEAARQWYEGKSPEAAAAFVAELDIAIESIQTAPELYPPYLYETRRYLMRRFPYLIVYRTTVAAIQVLAVAHERRRPGYWKTRSTR